MCQLYCIVMPDSQLPSQLSPQLGHDAQRICVDQHVL